jgi:mannosyltransferase OCH1-like enzyme
VADVICDGVIAKQNQVTVNVHAKELRFPALARELQQVQQRIPRIIHQTWFEDITLESYPQLYRLQNTWRASGWEYRFYTDDSARKYIQDNYPPRFVTIFDSIIPGAYKVWR